MVEFSPTGGTLVQGSLLVLSIVTVCVTSCVTVCVCHTVDGSAHDEDEALAPQPLVFSVTGKHLVWPKSGLT